jgi:hypothetical protein
LTASGLGIAKGLEKNREAFASEKGFLLRVGKALSEPQALKILKGADIA